MGYYATGAGDISFKKDADREKIKDIIKHSCSVDSWDVLSDTPDEFCVGLYQDDKYYEDEYHSLFSALAPFVKEGYMEFHGEDNNIWRFVFIDGKFIEEDAEIVWPSDKKEPSDNEPHTRGYMLCSVFGRELYTEQFKTLQGAREKMFEELQQELRIMRYNTNFYNWSAEEYDNENDDYPMGWHKYGAYFHNSNGELDWYIVPVE